MAVDKLDDRMRGWAGDGERIRPASGTAGPGSVGQVSVTVGERDDLAVCRMSRTLIEGDVSRLEFEYLIGTSGVVERRDEVHDLGLFTQGEVEGSCG